MFVDPLLHKLKWKGAYLGGLTEMQKEKNGMFLVGTVCFRINLSREVRGWCSCASWRDWNSDGFG